MSDSSNLNKNPEGGPIGNTKALKHGMSAVAQHGEQAMSAPQLSRYMELKHQFESEPGREEYRRELASLIAEICEQGFSQLRIDVEAGKNIWTQPGPLSRLAIYINSLTRLIDGWPKGGQPIAARHVLDAIERAGKNANTNG